MRHIYNYIIQISHEFNETFKTESGVELYGHKDFSKDRLSNRNAKIVGQPLIFDGELLDEGTEVLIDPSSYYHSTHGDDNIKQYTTNTIDMKKGLYAIEPQNIVLYKKNNEWNGYLDNFLGEQILEKEEDKMVGSFIIEVAKSKKTDKYNVIYKNKFLEENEVEVGEILQMKPKYGVSVWLDGKEYTWLRKTEVLAKIE